MNLFAFVLLFVGFLLVCIAGAMNQGWTVLAFIGTTLIILGFVVEAVMSMRRQH